MTRQPPTPAGSDTGCEAFARAVALKVDRELGPAETAALEAHLATCPACRARAREARALSAILKRWDAETAGRVQTPARVRPALRITVDDEGRWRRAEVRGVRRVRLATVASILLVLAIGLVLGLGAAGSGDVVRGATLPAVEVARVEAGPVISGRLPGARARLDVTLPGASHLSDFSVVRTDPLRWLSEEEKAAFGGVLAFAETRRLQREAFEGVVGKPAVWWTDPVKGKDRLVTVSALAHLRKVYRGAVFAMAPPEEGRTIVDHTPIVDTGRRIVDFLDLPGSRPLLEKVLAHTPILLEVPRESGPNDVMGRMFLLEGSRDLDASRAVAVRVSDLLRAVRDGFVTLREGPGEDLVAIVQGGHRPVFVPAGELIAGGRVDRVVMQGIWIPAVSTEQPIQIPCAAASTPGASHGEKPEPTGMVAGPGLRGLLARRADAQEVRGWIGRHVPILDRWGRDYSLLAFYDPAAQSRTLGVFTRYFLQQKTRGFVVTDVDGNLLGVETTDLPTTGAASLLARLFVGYVAENGMNVLRARLHGEAAEVRPDACSAVVALLDILGSEATFRARPRNGRTPRVLRMVDPRTRAAFEVVEQTSGSGAVLASGFAP